GKLPVLERQPDHRLADGQAVDLGHHRTDEQGARRDGAGRVEPADLAGLAPRHVADAVGDRDVHLAQRAEGYLLPGADLLGDLDGRYPVPVLQYQVGRAEGPADDEE